MRRHGGKWVLRKSCISGKQKIYIWMRFGLYKYVFIDLSAKKKTKWKKSVEHHFLAILKLPRIRAKNWIFCRVLDVFVRCFSQICKQGTEYFLTLQARTPNIPEKRYFPGKTVFLKMLFCWSKAEFSQRADSKIHTRNSRGGVNQQHRCYTG